jgi:hypothetical protein
LIENWLIENCKFIQPHHLKKMKRRLSDEYRKTDSNNRGWVWRGSLRVEVGEEAVAGSKNPVG